MVIIIICMDLFLSLRSIICLDGRPRNTMVERELSFKISIESVEIKSLFFIDGTLDQMMQKV